MDLKKATDELTTKAVFAAAKDKAERALEDALSTDEERATRKAVEEAAAKKKRTKLLVMGAVGLLLVLGAIGLVIHYWHWFLLAGLLGAAALYARHRWQKSRAERKVRVEAPAKAASEEPRVAKPVPRVEAARKATPAPAVDEASVEEELAALKAKLDK